MQNEGRCEEYISLIDFGLGCQVKLLYILALMSVEHKSTKQHQTDIKNTTLEPRLGGEDAHLCGPMIMR